MRLTDKLLKPLDSWDSEATWRTFETGLFHGSCRGVEVQKSAEDLERYRLAVERTQPTLIIETGTRAGGSALFFRHELDLSVITIDSNPQWRSRGVPEASRFIDWVIGSSIDPWVYIRALEQVTRYKHRVMVSLDSDHHADHVQQEIAVWSQLVSPGCYLVVEDACFDMWAADRARVGGGRIPEEGGALAAINRSLPLLRQRGFRRGVEIEGDSPVSHSPVGWWQKAEELGHE